MGLGGGEDDCVQQLRKSLLEEGREGSEVSGRRGGGREEMVGKGYSRKGMGGHIMYTYSNNSSLSVSYTNPPLTNPPSHQPPLSPTPPLTNPPLSNLPLTNPPSHQVHPVALQSKKELPCLIERDLVATQDFRNPADQMTACWKEALQFVVYLMKLPTAGVS